MVNAGRHMDEESGKKEEEKLDFTSEGVFVSKWGMNGTGDEGQIDYPSGIAVALDGNVYVSDSPQPPNPNIPLRRRVR